jgi:hypothetical protein
MENNEDFWLRYYNGSTWTTVASWARGSQFENNTFYTSTITLTSTQYTMASNAQFRFQCDASGNQDHIYIDAVTITASGPGVNSNGNQLIALSPMESGSDFDFEDDFIVYPNPVNGNIIKILLPVNSLVDVSIYSIDGQLLFIGKNVNEIDVSQFTPGMYLIEVNDGDEVMTKKFIRN